MGKAGVVKFFDALYPRLPVTVLLVYILAIGVTILGAVAVVPGWLGSSSSSALSLQWHGSWAATLVMGFVIFPLAIILSISFWGLGGYVYAGMKGVSDGVILANMIYVVLPGLDLFGGGVTPAQWVQVMGPLLMLVHGVVIMAFIAWPVGGVHVGTNLFYRLSGGGNAPAAKESTGKQKEHQMWYCAIAVIGITMCFVATYKFFLP